MYNHQPPQGTTPKGKLLKKIIAGLAIGSSVLLAVGCGKHTASPGASAVESSAKAQVSAFATSSAAATDKADAEKIAKKCLPDTGTITGIIEYKTLLSPSKGKDDRTKVVACMGIPAAQRPAAEQELLSSGETALAAQLLKHQKGALKDYATVTVPQIIVKYKYGK